MSEVSDDKAGLNNFNVYDYFSGGRPGVKKRIGEAIRKDLHLFNDSYIYDLCSSYHINPNVINEIRNNNYSNVNRDIFSAFTFPLGLNLSEVIGDPVYKTGEEGSLIKIMNENFNTSFPHINAKSKLKEFLIMKAYVDLGGYSYKDDRKNDSEFFKKKREELKKRLESLQE
jgi:hypothetical protein